MTNKLPQDSLPANPMELFKDWLDHAWEHAQVPNANAMCLTTVATDPTGEPTPSSRLVLMKDFDITTGFVVFYTNYDSRKGREIEQNSRVCAVLHWDNLGRQIRLEGQALKAPKDESDDYFQSRGRGSRIGAWSSDQSRPIDSRQSLIQKVEDAKNRFADTEDVPRPPHWGGYRIYVDQIEFWCDGDHRIHDRVQYNRTLAWEQGHPIWDVWSKQRLQP